MKEAIETFLQDRLASKLEQEQKALKKAQDENKQDECAKLDEKIAKIPNEFQPKTWIKKAVELAPLRKTHVSHTPKFSHPNAKADPILANAKPSSDGLLRLGNVASIETDSFGDSKAMAVEAFLSLTDDEGVSILQHVQQRSDSLVETLEAYQLDLDEVVSGLAEILPSTEDATSLSSDQLVKQVYFPVENDGYHLLSVLSASGIQHALQQRVDEALYSENTKAARKARKSEKEHDTGYRDFLGLVTIKYGGSNPRNIGSLNHKSRGNAYLLPSVPPRLRDDRPRLPTRSFFAQTLRYYVAEEPLKKLSKLLSADWNNRAIRDGINKCLAWSAECIVQKALPIQNWKSGWSTGERYAKLPAAQKRWLDPAAHTAADASAGREDATWQSEIAEDCARWLIRTYERINKQPISLGDDELRYIRDLIVEQGAIQ